MMAMNAKQPFGMHPGLQEPKFSGLHPGSEAMRRVCLPAPQVRTYWSIITALRHIFLTGTRFMFFSCRAEQSPLSEPRRACPPRSLPARALSFVCLIRTSVPAEPLSPY